MDNQPSLLHSAEVPRGRGYSASFMEFCRVYPTGSEDQPRAWCEWRGAVRRVSSPQVIIDAAKNYADDPHRVFTKAPWNWLANDAWNNPPCRVPIGKARGGPAAVMNQHAEAVRRMEQREQQAARNGSHHPQLTIGVTS